MSSITPELREQLLQKDWDFYLSFDRLVIYDSVKKTIISKIAIEALSEESKTDFKTILKGKKNLPDWVVEKAFEPEYGSRLSVPLQLELGTIKLAANKKTFFLDLRNSCLTSLPAFLPQAIDSPVKYLSEKLRLQNVKVRVFIEGNYLGEDAQAIIDRIENLENKEAIKKEITRQQEIASNPSLFLKNLKSWKKGVAYPANVAKKLSELLHKSSLETSEKVSNIIFVIFFPAFLITYILIAIIKIYLIATKILKILFFPISNYMQALRNLITTHALHFNAGNYLKDAHKLCLEACQGVIKADESKSYLKDIKKAFEHANEDCFSQETLEKIKRDELVILPVGYRGFFGGHAASVVIYKDKMIICNRGSRLPDEKAFQAFTIDKEKWSLHLLQNIKYLNTFSKFDQIGACFQSMYLYNALPLALGASSFDLSDEMITKDQKVGNCSIASQKAAFQAAIFLLNGQDSDAANLAKKQKKIFSSKLREHSLQALTCSKVYRFFSFFYGRGYIKKAQEKLETYNKKLLA